MVCRSFHRWLRVLGVLAVSALAGRAAAVGPGFTFQGQLLDNSMPRNGMCDFRFQLFDVPTGGSPIGNRTEIIPFVTVQNGLFTVKLNSTGQLGPTAFGGSDRWLEISARCPAVAAPFAGVPMSPRREITAVPYALYAPPQPPAGTRFTDNGDGTVTDHSTSLMWEKKTGTVGAAVICSTTTCADPRNVNNAYEWCEDTNNNGVCDNIGPFGDNPPDGGAFYDFLSRTNGRLCDSSDCTGLGGHTDWRVPTLAELQTIVTSPCPAGEVPCLDPLFLPAVRSRYWSSTPLASGASAAWYVNFNGGGSGNFTKTNNIYVRAVRGGP